MAGLDGRPVDIGTIFLFHLLRFDLDYNIVHIPICGVVKPNGREEPNFNEVFLGYSIVHLDCVGDIAEREAALLPVGIGIVWGLGSSYKGSRLCVHNDWRATIL